jgi:hypothetical protein
VITKEEAIQKFKDILLAKASWKTLSKSQFVNHLAVFMSWALREALWKIERTFQEYFLSTALNEASVLAHVEDREYLPRKRTPSSGSGTITNNGTSVLYLPAYQPFSSDADLDYVTDRALSLAAGEAAEVEFSQMVKEEIVHEVTEEKPFYEILFDKALTEKIHDFTVQVDLGYGYEEWDCSRLFQNANEGDHVYDEFYTHAGQTGIRFGNDYIGTILPVGTSVKVSLWLTDGETYLAEGQPLYPVGEVLDASGQVADMEAITTEAITDGQAKETVSEMRQNLQYWPIYNEKLVWRDDYVFFIKRAVASILWINVWGETEAEAIHGPRFEFINKIFVSSYAEDRPNLETEVMSALSDVHILNRKFEWVAPLLSTFHLTITGKVPRTVIISDVQAAIIEALTDNYGKDSSSRLSEVLVKDFYRIINATGYFSTTGAYFNVTHAGTLEPTELNEMVHIDMDATTISLSYL